MRIQFTVTDEELEILTKKAIEGGFPSVTEYCKCSSLQENTSYILIGKRPVKDKKYKQNVKKYKNLQKNSRKRYYYPINVIKYI